MCICFTGPGGHLGTGKWPAPDSPDTNWCLLSLLLDTLVLVGYSGLDHWLTG